MSHLKLKMATELNITKKLQYFLQTIKADLDRTMEFWLKHSYDSKNGGFFTCLGETGKLYDELKYGWLQGRQVWMYAKLYNELERYHTSQIISEAEHGADFLMNHIKDSATWKCYFLVTRDGKPVKLQRTIFCECFYLLAMSELAKATNKQKYKEEAVGMLNKIQHWALVDDTELGRPKLAGQTPTNSMAVPMMMLCVALQLLSNNFEQEVNKKINSLIDWAIEQILAHVQRSGKIVLENVTSTGKELPGSQGRLTIPGHTIEAGWFLLQIAQQRNNEHLKQVAMKTFMLKPFEWGWDRDHGGLFYFLDADHYDPTQLEWSHKLWWPHNEAMIAFIMAYEETGDMLYLNKFEQVFDYSYKNFVDKINGEWYGYLHQNGTKNMHFKGGPFKGCFHVPRCLLMCEQILTKLIQRKS